jgi:ArsR family transcriptional regulator, arsenate/arsenite/antimonite-responsive transcriptional repressor
METSKKLILLSEVFKALSDPTRLKIITLLASSRNLCVNMIANKIGMTQPAISQHLKILKQADILDAEKIGLEVHYSINEKIITEYMNNFINIFKEKQNQLCLKCPEKSKD